MITSTKRPHAQDFSGRDLAFRPADPATASTLTPAQVEHYNTEGFIRPIDVFEEAEAIAVRRYIDDLVATVDPAGDGRSSYSVVGHHTVCAGLWDLATEPRILAAVADLLGTNLVCWGSQLFAKLAHDPKVVPFHQDAVYWPFTTTRTVTAWLAIDDADRGNAAMELVPGSHRDGPIPHEVLDLDGSRVLGRRALGMEARPQRAVDELRAGQMSLHSDLLLHGSGANTSDRRRAGLTLRYTAADSRLMDGFEEWGRWAVHVLDGDPSGHWPHHARPSGERPDLMTEPWADPDSGPQPEAR